MDEKPHKLTYVRRGPEKERFYWVCTSCGREAVMIQKGRHKGNFIHKKRA